MARIPYVNSDDLPEGHQIPLMKSNITRAVANSPNMARLVAGMGTYLRHNSPLEPRLRELAILQVGYTTRSVYEWAHHVDIALKFGLEPKDIRAISIESAGGSSHLKPLERAVLSAARELTTDIKLSKETFDQLSGGLDRAALVDLLVAIGEYNGLVRVMAAIEIDLEPEYEERIREFPL